MRRNNVLKHIVFLLIMQSNRGLHSDIFTILSTQADYKFQVSHRLSFRKWKNKTESIYLNLFIFHIEVFQTDTNK